MTDSAAAPSENYIVRQSSIHGEGVYARRRIPCGSRVIEYVGEKISKAESERRGNMLFQEARSTGGGAVYLFILNKTTDLDGNVPWNTARLINHSCDPNCEALVIRGRIWYVAARDIEEGEELSINYGFELENWEDHPCRCGTSRCVGYIVAEEYWSRLKRLLRGGEAASRKRRARPQRVDVAKRAH